MPRDSAGNYTLTAGNPVVSGTVISSGGWWNPLGTDLTTVLTDSLSRSGLGGMLAQLALVDGTVGTPAMGFVSEAGLGIYRSAAGAMSFTSGGVLRLTMDSGGKFTIPAITSASGNALTLTGIAAAASPPLLINMVNPADGGIRLTGSQATFTQGIFIANTSAANTAANYGLEVQNDTVGKELYVVNTSTTFAGAFLAGLVAGAACGIGALNNQFFIATGATIPRLLISSAGVITAWEGTLNVGTAALMNNATYETGTFTATLTGCTTSPTTVINWRRCGPIVTLVCDVGVTATSSAGVPGNSCTLTGLPANLAPAKICTGSGIVTDNSVNEIGLLQISALATVIQLGRSTSALNTFTAGVAGKGSNRWSFTYSIL